MFSWQTFNCRYILMPWGLFLIYNQTWFKFFPLSKQNLEDRRGASLHQDTGEESGTDEDGYDDDDRDNGNEDDYGDDEDEDDYDGQSEDDVIDLLDGKSEQVLPSESDVAGRDENMTKNDVIDLLNDESAQVLPPESNVVRRDENMAKNDVIENELTNQIGNFIDEDEDYKVPQWHFFNAG